LLSQLMHIDFTSPGLKWNCAYGLQQQCLPRLTAWVRDQPEQVMVAQVSYGSCPMCQIPTRTLLGKSTFRPLINSRDQHVYPEMVEDDNIDALQSRDVCTICNQLWQSPLRNVYRLWLSDTIHQLLLGLANDLLQRLLKYLKPRNVMDQFDNQFTSVLRYPSLQHFLNAFD